MRRYRPCATAARQSETLKASLSEAGDRRQVERLGGPLIGLTVPLLLWLPGPLDAGSWLRCPDICHNGVYATPAAYRATGPDAL